jgi:hypothetical protein
VRPLPVASILLLAGACGALLGTRAALANASPSVWVIDDGEKIRRDATSTPFERGEHDPVWRPGGPVRAFAMRNETIALQVVVEAGDAPLPHVTVDMDPLGAVRVERFVEHFLQVRRPSGGRTPGESLGWQRGSGPDPRAWVGPVPDALVPVALAAPWIPYPMSIAPHTNGIVWIDLAVPRDAPSGGRRSALHVRDGDRTLADIPVELDVADARLPDRTAGAVLYYDPSELARRIGPGAERQLWMLLHEHRIAPMHDATSAEDVDRQRAALDGSLYDPAAGYAGPGPRQGDGVLVFGAYGALGPPDARGLARVRAIADRVAADGLWRGTDLLLYATDEDCESPWGAGWRALLRASDDASVRRLRVAWTCSRDPSGQPVDVPILLAAWDAAQVARARAAGKEVWVYNGVLPRTGTFLLDAPAISPRVNGWLSALFGIPRWFYWESTFWYGRHDARPIDPFVEPETLHNDDGDWANGDGVLVYPGDQIDGSREHSLHFQGVVPSIRLKNWRRGLQDAGYLELARATDAARADAVARRLVPSAFGDAQDGRPPSWSPRGEAFFEARRALLDVVLGRPPSPFEMGPRPTGRAGAPAGCSRRATAAVEGAAGALLVVGGGALGLLARRRRRRAP